jgi:CubicO group peptidase (beta-lactamase class C family)
MRYLVSDIGQGGQFLLWVRYAMFTLRSGLVAMGLFYCAALYAQPNLPITGEALPGLEAFDQAMLNVFEENDLPGGTLAVAYQGRLLLAKGYGFASKGFTKSELMQPKIRLHIASLSKSITSAAVMLLVERGQLKLDDTVLEVLGDSAPAAKDLRDSRVARITVRQLLEHRGGWDRTESQDPMFERAPLCPSRVRRFLETTMLDFVPGERSAYSNVGYCILGRVIEKVSSKSYGDFVKDAIAGPLGIKSFELGTAKGSLPDEGEYFVTQNPRGRTTSPYGGFSIEAMDAVGGWVTTAAGFLRFLNALDGTRKPALLKPEVYAELIARPNAADSFGKPVYYAKGLNVRPVGVAGANIWHAGSLPGTLSFAAKLANGWSYVAIFNKRPENWQKTRNQIDRLLGVAARKAAAATDGALFVRF